MQGEVDERPKRGRFIRTGSGHLTLLHPVSQSLAGRTAIANLLPCGYDEVCRFLKAPTDLSDVMVRGGYPAIFDRGLEAADWFASYITTYLERDVRQVLNGGAIFESWVVTEIVKARANRGVSGGMYFLRDARGAEIDVLVETGERLLAAEVKSGQTVAGDFGASFARLAEALDVAAAGRERENVLVYGGDSGQRRSTATVLPWQRVPTYRWHA